MSVALPVSLEDILVTDELHLRPARAPEFQAESQALLGLLKVLKKDTDGNIFQHLAETALRLCKAHSAGVSIEEEGQGRRVLRWYGAAGRWSPFLWQTLPRESSPSSVALDRNAPILMAYPERYFMQPHWGMPPRIELLVAPFEVGGLPVGTVWVSAHDDTRCFDREDLRLLTTLSESAALGYQVLQRNVKVQEALATERRGSQLLQAISAGLTREDDATALTGQILNAAMAIMSADFATLQIFEIDHLRLLAHRGLHPATVEFLRVTQPESPCGCGTTVRTGERTIIVDTEESAPLAGTEDLTALRQSGVRAMQSTPLMSRTTELVGVLSTAWRTRHEPSTEELQLFDVLARLAADLMERASTHQALRDRDQRKNEFLAVLSHELRNPLAPITTGLELLRRPDCTPEMARTIHTMMSRQVSHLTRLVNDLLDLSRITRGKIELRRTPVCLCVVIEGAIELARPLIAQRQQVLLTEHGDPMVVDGDPDRLTQVLANVLSNAAKYTDPKGEIRLQVQAQAGQAVVRIRDTGLGIPPGRLEAVFEMFTQIPEHRERSSGGGLGIGLALSRRLIELHGGSIVARSAGLGSGSEFIIRLPLATAARLAAVRTAPQDPLPAPAPRRVLIIEDNVDAATTLHVALESAGHTVRIAHDGPTGLALLEQSLPEVVLLDIGLPGMDGYETARHIRSAPGAGSILIIAITGWGQESDREHARQAGVDVHLTKPVTFEALQAVLHKVQS